MFSRSRSVFHFELQFQMLLNCYIYIPFILYIRIFNNIRFVSFLQIVLSYQCLLYILSIKSFNKMFALKTTLCCYCSYKLLLKTQKYPLVSSMYWIWGTVARKHMLEQSFTVERFRTFELNRLRINITNYSNKINSPF